MRLTDGYRLLTLESVESTNDLTKDKGREGELAGLVITALEQTKGRGRLGNQWASSRGNLFMSILLRPQVKASRAGQISFVVAVAVADVLASLLPAQTEVRLKWPNDILVNGRKICGILLESEIGKDGILDWLVVGIGINITTSPDFATNLKEEGMAISTDEVLVKIVDRVDNHLTLWLKDGFSSIRHKWLDRAYGLKEQVSARLPSGTKIGIFEGLDEEGALILKTQDGQLDKITAGDIFWEGTDR